MRILILVFGLSSLVSMTTGAAEAEPEPCSRIREQIQAQTGIPARPDTALLQKISARQECRFSAAEVYRAAWGDKPVPRNENRDQHRDRHHDDD